MKTRTRNCPLPVSGARWVLMALATLPLFLTPANGFLAAQTTVIQADRVMTSTAEGIVGPRFILIEDGKIASVTTRRPSSLPLDVQLFRAGFLTPGFIDARTTLGLSGLHPADDDRDESSGPNQAHLRAVDAFDLNDPMVGNALRGGVTTVQAGPGDANSIGGQAGIFKLSAATVNEAIVRFPSGVVFSLDESAKLTYGNADRFPSTRMANAGLIRQALIDANRYRDQANGDEPPSRDLRMEALAMVLGGEIPALVSAERADELATALRLEEEFGIGLRIVGAADAQVVLDRLVQSGVPILLGPAGDAALRTEDGDLLLETAAKLRERHIPFALVTGDDKDAPRSSLLELAKSAVRGGLSLEGALEAITITPARILGLGERMGSIEAGKEADLVLFDGDPLNASTQVRAVFVGGKAVYVRGGEG